MQTIGEKLEEARKHKGISLREAAEVTKIRGEYLASLEGDSFDIKLPEIYLRGFLKNYATFLKLNPEKILADYDVLNLGRPLSYKKNEGGETEKSGSSKKKSGEFFGRMDLPEQKKPFSRKKKTVPASKDDEAESQEEGAFYESFDRTLYMKVGAIAGGSLLLILLVFFLVRAITTPGPSESMVELPTSAPVSQELFLVAGGDILNVKVTQIASDTVLFEGSLSAGDREQIAFDGTALRLTVTNREHLRIERNGNFLSFPGSGPAQTTIQ